MTSGIIDKDKLNLPENVLMTDKYLISNARKTYPILNLNNFEVRIAKPNIELLEVEIMPTIPLYSLNPLNPKQETTESKALEKSRRKCLNDNIRKDHLNREEIESLLQICGAYQDIFYLPGDKLSSTTTLTHSIETTDPSPIFTKTYRYPKIHENEVNKQMTKMLDENIIQHSTSPWSSPVWVVPKKLDASNERKWRIVIDYRKLNEVTISDAHPIPNIEDILDQLGDAKYFTTLDLASGFHQIEMNPEDKQKTAFSTPLGHYEFNRMPFGLKNAPATFQRLMNTVLAGLQGIDCFVYLDDIVIYGKSLSEHNERLTKIFEKLRTHNLKLQVDKCEFLRKEVAYLGHIISEKGVKPNPDKIQAILNIKTPKNQKDIKSFLGLVGYYRKFIPKFAHISKPLTKLLKKDTPFNFDENCIQSFNTLKQSLTQEPILQYPNFNEPFVLTTDASNEAIGSILSQGQIGKDLPISYFSKTLNSAEKNYSTTEKELLAIVQSVKHFRPYLYGTKFTIVTDHKPLTWLFNCKDPSSRLVRWRLKLLEYDYKITYKPGVQNTNADALSRPINHIKDSIITADPKEKSFANFQKFHYQNVTPKSYKRIEIALEKVQNLIIPYSCDLSQNNRYSEYVTKNCPTLSNFKNHRCGETALLNSQVDQQKIFLIFIKNFAADKVDHTTLYECFENLNLMLNHNKITDVHLINICQDHPNLKDETFNSLIEYTLNKNIQVSIITNDLIHPKSNEEKLTIMQEYHDHPLAGHPGINRTYENIKKYYFWKNMKSDIEKHVQNCKNCQTIKTSFQAKTPMIITTVSNDFNEQVAMDIMGPYPVTELGNRFILTIQDDLTKYIQAYPIPEHNAEVVALHFLKYCTIFGFPNNILTDQGSEFTSKLLKEITKLLDIKHKLATPYHPQTNGSLERSHLTLRDYIKSYIDKDHNWDELIYLASHAYNTHTNRNTNETPYKLVFGIEPRIPSSLLKPKQKPTYQNLTQDIVHKMKSIREIAKENLQNSKTKTKEYYDKRTKPKSFQIGEQVLLKNELGKAQSKKLDPSFKGPYLVTNVYDNNTATIRLSPTKEKRYHFNLLKHFISDQNESLRDNPEPDDATAGPSK